MTQVDYAQPWRQSLVNAMAHQLAPDAVVASWPPGIGTIDLPDGGMPPRPYWFLNPDDDHGTLVGWLRKQPDTLTMPDGRRWNALPFVVILARSFDCSYKDTARDPIYLTWRDGPNARGAYEAAIDLRIVIGEYWRRLLDELDECGFLIRYHEGRLIVTRAYRSVNVDRRLIYHSGEISARLGHVLSVYPSLANVEAETDAFERLINDSNVNEATIHEFLERHPHFLSERGAVQPLSHTRLVQADGRVLVPDFVIRPKSTPERDRRWKVLDLKTPRVPLLVGPRRRRRLSAEIQRAIRQLLDYGDYFANPMNAAHVNATLGYSLRFPRLAVLVGRLPADCDSLALSHEQMRYPHVAIVTYDEILEEQKSIAAQSRDE